MFGDATALYGRARNWAIGSDPGLLRLRMATRTTGALATALLVLFAADQGRPPADDGGAARRVGHDGVVTLGERT